MEAIQTSTFSEPRITQESAKLEHGLDPIYEQFTEYPLGLNKLRFPTGRWAPSLTNRRLENGDAA